MLEAGGEPFRMFDFAPVGVGVAIAGVAFIALVGWRMIPKREGQASREDLFRIEEYTTEVRIPDESPLVGKLLRDIESAADVDLVIVGLVRHEQHLPSLSLEVAPAPAMCSSWRLIPRNSNRWSMRPD